MGLDFDFDFDDPGIAMDIDALGLEGIAVDIDATILASEQGRHGAHEPSTIIIVSSEIEQRRPGDDTTNKAKTNSRRFPHVKCR